LDRIPAGSYTILICSNNTNGPHEQSNKVANNCAEFKDWFNTTDKMSSLTLSVLIKYNKYVVKQIDFGSGESRELHHDFGITWW
jgi:hypothetical protein